MAKHIKEQVISKLSQSSRTRGRYLENKAQIKSSFLMKEWEYTPEMYADFTPAEQEFLESFEGRIIASFFRFIDEIDRANRFITFNFDYQIKQLHPAFQVLYPYYRKLFDESAQVRGVVYLLYENVPEDKLVSENIRSIDDFFCWIVGNKQLKEKSGNTDIEKMAIIDEVIDSASNPES